MAAKDYFGNVGTAAAGAGIGVITNAINGAINSAYARKMAEFNYELNEKAANNADARRRAMYEDYESPAATIRQLKEAGLSPSLYASGELGGNIGSTAGAQGAGAGGAAIPANMGDTPNLAAMHLQEAQARLANAEADKLEGKNAEGAANVSKILEEAGYYKAARALKEMETSEKELDVALKEISFDANTKHAQALAEKAYYDSRTSMYESFKAMSDANVAEQTQQARIDKAFAEVKLINAQELVNKSLKNLNEAQKERIAAEIDKWQKEVAISYKEACIKAKDAQTRREFNKITDDYYDSQVEVLQNRLGLDNKKFNVAIVEMVIRAYQKQLALAADALL